MATRERLPFSWQDVESLPDLERLRLVLDVLPDEEILASLEAGRGRGRNDYPVMAMWRALIAGVVFQHASIQSLLRELGRNPALLDLCGFYPLPASEPSRPRAAYPATTRWRWSSSYCRVPGENGADSMAQSISPRSFRE